MSTFSSQFHKLSCWCNQYEDPGWLELLQIELSNTRCFTGNYSHRVLWTWNDIEELLKRSGEIYFFRRVAKIIWLQEPFLHFMQLFRDTVFFDTHLNLGNLLFLYTSKQGWFFKVFVQVLLVADLSPIGPQKFAKKLMVLFAGSRYWVPGFGGLI